MISLASVIAGKARGRVLASLVLVMATAPVWAAHAGTSRPLDTVSYSGTFGPPGGTWARPSSVTQCGMRTTAGMYYDARHFTVGTTGMYTMTMTAASLSGALSDDGFFALYTPSFDPTMNQANCIATDNDGGVGNLPSIINFTLNSGVNYVLVSTTGDFGQTGTFSNEITGPGTVTLAPPTAARVLSFTARRGRVGVELRWRTAQETGLLGFNVYRSGVKANRSLIFARGAVAGAGYRIVDRRPGSSVSHAYRLQAVRLDGSRAWLGKALVRA